MHSSHLTESILKCHRQHQVAPLDEEGAKPTPVDKKTARRRKQFNLIMSQHPDDKELELLASFDLDFMPDHFHCPSWRCCRAYSTFEELQKHCTKAHSNTLLDPLKTPSDPSTLHTPLLNTVRLMSLIDVIYPLQVSIDILPLRRQSNQDDSDESDDESEDTTTPDRTILQSSEPTAMDRTPPTRSSRAGGPSARFSLYHPTTEQPRKSTEIESSDPRRRRRRVVRLLTSSSASKAFHSLVGSPPLRRKGEELIQSCFSVEGREPGMTDREVKRVRFSNQVRLIVVKMGINDDQVYQVTYDKNRSQVEKYGSTLGMII